jgi:hypothetical protein
MGLSIVKDSKRIQILVRFTCHYWNHGRKQQHIPCCPMQNYVPSVHQTFFLLLTDGRNVHRGSNKTLYHIWVMTVGNSVGETKEANCAPHVVPLLHTCTCTIVGAESGCGVRRPPPPPGYFAPVISCVTTTLNKLKCYKCT